MLSFKPVAYYLHIPTELPTSLAVGEKRLCALLSRPLALRPLVLFLPPGLLAQDFHRKQVGSDCALPTLCRSAGQCP